MSARRPPCAELVLHKFQARNSTSPAVHGPLAAEWVQLLVRLQRLYADPLLLSDNETLTMALSEAAVERELKRQAREDDRPLSSYLRRALTSIATAHASERSTDTDKASR